MTYEQKKRELAAIADKLESGKTTLAEAAALYEEGVKLARECEVLLTAIEGKITILGEDGKETDFTV